MLKAFQISSVVMETDVFELNLDSDEFQTSPIFSSIIRGNHQHLLSAIYAGHSVHLRDSDFSYTYLHIVVTHATPSQVHKYVPMVYQLSNASINVHATDYKGRTALELAIIGELQDLITALLRVGADHTPYKQFIREMDSPFKYEILDAIEKYEPGLWTAVQQNNGSLVHMLLNSWCRANVSRHGRTLLQFAKDTHKSADIVSTLGDYECTIEFVHATLAGDEKRMLEHLMDSCDPAIMDISFQPKWQQTLTPRSLRDTALAMEHRHILHLLPEPEYDYDNIVPNLSLPGSSERSEDLTPPTARKLVNHRNSVMSDNSGGGNKGNLTDRSSGTRTDLKDRSIKTNGILTNRSLMSIPSSIKRAGTYMRRKKSSQGELMGGEKDAHSVYSEQWYYFHDVEEFVNESPLKNNTKTDINSSGYETNWTKHGLRHRAEEKLKTTTSKMCTIS